MQLVSTGPIEDLNPHTQKEELTTNLIEDLVELEVVKDQPTRTLKLGKNLCEEIRSKQIEILLNNLDEFAW